MGQQQLVRMDQMEAILFLVLLLALVAVEVDLEQAVPSTAIMVDLAVALVQKLTQPHITVVLAQLTKGMQVELENTLQVCLKLQAAAVALVVQVVMLVAQQQALVERL